MHWATKVFIVGAAVLSVLLAALVMAYSVNVKEIRDEHANLLAQKQTAEANLQAQNLQFGEVKGGLERDRDAKESEAAMLRQQISQLQGENSTARADKLRAESERDAISGKISQLGETSKTLTTLVEKLTDEVRSLREAELKFRKREIELVDRNNDLEAQKEVLTQQSRALEEQVAELKQINANPIAGTDNGGTPQLITAVNGRVTQIKRDAATGDLLAQIDLGTNDGVKEKMELWLARDTTLLGKLTIMKSDLRTAIGRVDTLNIKAKDPNTGKPMEIQPEDRVYASPFR